VPRGANNDTETPTSIMRRQQGPGSARHAASQITSSGEAAGMTIPISFTRLAVLSSLSTSVSLVVSSRLNHQLTFAAPPLATRLRSGGFLDRARALA